MNDSPSLAQKLRALGNQLTPETLGATAALVAPLHAKASTEGVQITRDRRYGPADRNRLDIFERAKGAAAAGAAPVLLFVHGGGFIQGDKNVPNSPFYDNVGLWAVRHGLIGVTMTYRLAPENPWPAGSEDVSLAVKWLRENIAAHGGDLKRVFVMGQSAGAVHVAGYIAREFSETAGAPPRTGWKPAGAVLISGLYDTDTMDRDARFRAYFGTDDAKLENASFLGALVSTNVPLLATLSDLDPPEFLRQFVVLLDACLRRQVKLPRFIQLTDHNHVSPAWRMNTDTDTLGPELLTFFSAQQHQ